MFGWTDSQWAVACGAWSGKKPEVLQDFIVIRHSYILEHGEPEAKDIIIGVSKKRDWGLVGDLVASMPPHF